jgi:pimeloyl-ACP methyl ester carboxylesterase
VGVYYDPVTFLSGDGTRLEGWIVPVLDARKVVEQKEAALARKEPAVVLVHDFGRSRQQMLPLIRPLHDAGFVVLAINLRGSGASDIACQTFGLKEASDVEAAVELLRRRTYIDPGRVGVIGIGTGANAALIAAQRDPNVAAVVLQDPITQSAEALDHHLGATQPWLRWLDPLCKCSFEISCGVDLDELNISRYHPMMIIRPVLLMDTQMNSARVFNRRGQAMVCDFLTLHLKPWDVAAAQ